MHTPASVLKKDSHKLLWDFDIQTDRLISARRPHLIIIKKKKKKENLQNCGLTVPADHRIKLKESEKKFKYLDQGIEKTVEHEGDDYTNCDWCIRYSN